MSSSVRRRYACTARPTLSWRVRTRGGLERLLQRLSGDEASREAQAHPGTGDRSRDERLRGEPGDEIAKEGHERGTLPDAREEDELQILLRERVRVEDLGDRGDVARLDSPGRRVHDREPREPGSNDLGVGVPLQPGAPDPVGPELA